MASTINNHKQRLARLRHHLNRASREPTLGPTCAIFTSAPEARRAGQICYPYRQDSDLWYLTGSNLKGIALLVDTLHDSPLLLASKKRWSVESSYGHLPHPAELAATLGTHFSWYDGDPDFFRRYLRGIKTLVFQNVEGSWSCDVALSFIKAPRLRIQNLPRQFLLSDIIMRPLRAIKDRAEITQIKKAINLASEILPVIAAQIRPGVTEASIAASIRSLIVAAGAHESFPPMIASGPASALPHYFSLTRTMRRGEMVLVDYGAELEMYSSDITRMFPVSGRFSPWQSKLYAIIEEAIDETIAYLTPGITLAQAQERTDEVLTEGLRALGVLKGGSKKLLRERAIHAYSQHDVGHSLGIEVHDIEDLFAPEPTPLAPGMVITIEPGLYFKRAIPKARGRPLDIPKCGFRLEENVVITGSGASNLSAHIPRVMTEIEALMERGTHAL